MFFFSVYCVAYGSFFGEPAWGWQSKVNKSIASHHLHGAWDQGGGGLEIFTWSWTSLHEITYTVAEAAKPVVFLWIPSPFHPRWSLIFEKTCKFMQFVSHETRRHDDVVTNKVTMWERICHSKIVPDDLWDEESASNISLFFIHEQHSASFTQFCVLTIFGMKIYEVTGILHLTLLVQCVMICTSWSVHIISIHRI